MTTIQSLFDDSLDVTVGSLLAVSVKLYNQCDRILLIQISVDRIPNKIAMTVRLRFFPSY